MELGNYEASSNKITPAALALLAALSASACSDTPTKSPTPETPDVPTEPQTPVEPVEPTTPETPIAPPIIENPSESLLAMMNACGKNDITEENVKECFSNLPTEVTYSQITGNSYYVGLTYEVSEGEILVTTEALGESYNNFLIKGIVTNFTSPEDFEITFYVLPGEETGNYENRVRVLNQNEMQDIQSNASDRDRIGDRVAQQLVAEIQRDSLRVSQEPGNDCSLIYSSFSRIEVENCSNKYTTISLGYDSGERKIEIVVGETGVKIITLIGLDGEREVVTDDYEILKGSPLDTLVNYADFGASGFITDITSVGANSSTVEHASACSVNAHLKQGDVNALPDLLLSDPSLSLSDQERQYLKGMGCSGGETTYYYRENKVDGTYLTPSAFRVNPTANPGPTRSRLTEYRNAGS